MNAGFTEATVFFATSARRPLTSGTAPQLYYLTGSSWTSDTVSIFGDGAFMVNSGTVLVNSELLVVPTLVSQVQSGSTWTTTRLEYDFWLQTGGFPGHRTIVPITGTVDCSWTTSTSATTPTTAPTPGWFRLPVVQQANSLAPPTFSETATAPTFNATTALQVGGININTIYAPLASPIFTGIPRITIGSQNYSISTQPWVGGWFQVGSMTVGKQIGLNNFSVARTPQTTVGGGSFDITFPAHPSGGSYVIVLTPRMSSGNPILYGYGGSITSTGFTVRFTRLDTTTTPVSLAPVDAELSLIIPPN